MGIYILPKKLDEEVARLHLEKIGVKLTTLSKRQADYLGVPVGWALQGGALPLLDLRSGLGRAPAISAGVSLCEAIVRRPGTP